MEDDETRFIFDLVFKKLLRISKKALLCLINAQFNTSYPLDSPVEYLNTQHITKNLGYLYSDCVILIAQKYLYHFEAEIKKNPDMALRMFVYGFEIGREHRDLEWDPITKKKPKGVVIRFPYAKVFYWNPNSRNPNKLSITLIFPDGTSHKYTVEAYKPLEHSIAELQEQQMVLLLPFHLMKFRAAVERSRTEAERHKLAGEIAELTKSLITATKQSVRDKILTEEERTDVLDLMLRLQNEIYKDYTEIKETNMDIVNGEIVTVREQWEQQWAKEREKERKERKQQETAKKKEVRALNKQISDLKAGLALVEKQSLSGTAQKLKAIGVSVAQIAAATGLSPEEIRGL
jgi:hypothetical protein